MRFTVPNFSACVKVSERVGKGERVPDPRTGKRGGRVGGAEEGGGVADSGGAAAGNGNEDDQGKNRCGEQKFAKICFTTNGCAQGACTHPLPAVGSTTAVDNASCSWS